MTDQGVPLVEMSTEMNEEINLRHKKRVRRTRGGSIALVATGPVVFIFANLVAALLMNKYGADNSSSMSVSALIVVVFAGALLSITGIVQFFQHASGMKKELVQDKSRALTQATIPAIESRYGVALSEGSKKLVPKTNRGFDDAPLVRFTKTSDGTVGVGLIERKNNVFYLYQINFEQVEARGFIPA